jgi:hypothetical protein
MAYGQITGRKNLIPAAAEPPMEQPVKRRGRPRKGVTEAIAKFMEIFKKKTN